MISVSTFAFVLALAAAVCGAAALIISFRLRAAQASLRSTIGSALRNNIARVEAVEKKASEHLHELRAQTPVKLAAEVAALSDAVARLAATHRRFAGKFHAEKHAPVANGATEEFDDEIAAHLALQTAPPRAPGT